MKKNQKILIWGGLAVAICLIGLIIVLIVNSQRQADAAYEAELRADSLALANDRLLLTNEFNQLNADFSQYENQQVYLQNDSLVQQYNQARMKVEGLLKELDAEKRSNANNRARIKKLEGEIATLKGIVRHYLEEIKRLGEENAGLRQEIQQVTQRNEQLASQVTTTTRDNEQLAATVKVAKQLKITGLTLSAYNKKGKTEKNITKAKSLGVSFSVSPNATASAGMKEFYVRIVSPEGELLGNGGSFSTGGQTVSCTDHRAVEYNNEETPVTVYWTVNTTLTKGTYRVEVYNDGNLLGSKSISMAK